MGKKNSNIVLVQKKKIDEYNQEIDKKTINLDYAWDEVKKNIEVNGCVFDDNILKKAYLIYLKHHYKLGCNQHKHYKGYQKLIEFIEPLIFDFTSDEI